MALNLCHYHFFFNHHMFLTIICLNFLQPHWFVEYNVQRPILLLNPQVLLINLQLQHPLGWLVFCNQPFYFIAKEAQGATRGGVVRQGSSHSKNHRKKYLQLVNNLPISRFAHFSKGFTPGRCAVLEIKPWISSTLQKKQ